MSEMTWIVPLGSVRTAQSRAISAVAASMLGKRSDSTRSDDSSCSFASVEEEAVAEEAAKLMVSSLDRKMCGPDGCALGTGYPNHLCAATRDGDGMDSFG